MNDERVWPSELKEGEIILAIWITGIFMNITQLLQSYDFKPDVFCFRVESTIPDKRWHRLIVYKREEVP